MRSRVARADRAALVVALGTSALLSLTGIARAGGEAPLGGAQLRYARGRGAEACPDGAALVAEVVHRLGYDPFQREAARALDVVVEGDGVQLRASITLTEAGGAPSTHRLVSSAVDCSVLRPTLGLAIALAIDPTRAVALDAGPALPPPPPPPPFPRTFAPAPLLPRAASGDDVVPRRTAATTEEAAPRRRATVYAGAYAAVAAAPTTTGGFELGGAVVYRHLSIGAELRGDVPIKDAGAIGRIEVGRVFGEGVPCFRTLAFGFGVCALAAVGLTVARGHGYRVSRDVFLPYAGLGARLMVEIPIARRVAFGLHADVLGLLVRAALRVDSTVEYRDAPATGAFGFNFVARLGDGS
jgi:hypothetical protein